MKPHLPITLFCALLCTFVARAVEIPDDYTQIDLQTPSDLNSYQSNSADDKYAFAIQTDIDFTPTTNTTWNTRTPLVKEGHLLFTTTEGDKPSAISFSGGQSPVFEYTNSLTFDTLSNLIISNLTISDQTVNNKGGAINLGTSGTLLIRNVNDGINSSESADVIFSGNKVNTSYGSTIHANGVNTLIDITNNGYVIFSKNSASYSRNGVIYSMGTININNNEVIAFDNNTAVGAINSGGLVNINNNTIVSFSTNSSTGGKGGGAISSTGIVNINNNIDVNFSKNYASTSSSYGGGGAIYSNGTLNIINNTNVAFIENYAPSADGGAIYSAGTININSNDNVYFRGNHNSTVSNYGGGAAIYSSGSISIVGNDSVTFEKNYEIHNRTYQLRSIYMNPNSIGLSLALSAKTEGCITFYDSVYMDSYIDPTVSLNADYKDANGVTQKAGGEIIFSGKYTEEHLKEIKGGTAGTTSEIENSRTSQLLNTVNLYGGTLSVEDKAVLKTHAINVVQNGNATMKVSDAKVDATSYDITVDNSGTLLISSSDGSSLIIAKNINIQEGASLSLTRTEVATDNTPITLAVVDSLSYYNDKIGGTVKGNLNLAGGSTYIADGAHLGMDGGVLTFFSTTEKKINLVLTLGAQYDENAQILLFSDVDTAKFLQDNITATSNASMITLKASDYFTGDWINDETTLVYDSGNIYVSGVNVVIPEPTTTTLSLLALAGLAARRRRKS